MQFWEYDFKVSQILLVVEVVGAGEPIHRNRPSHGLVYVPEGRYSYVFDGGRRETVGPGEMFYLPKYSSYTAACVEDGRCIAINFDLADREASFPFCRWPEGFSRTVAAHFVAAEKLYTQPRPGNRFRCMALLYEILGSIARYGTGSYADAAVRDRLRPALAYIQENCFREEITVAQLADMTGITPEYFRQLFHRVHGQSPKRYIIGLRMERARELLASGMVTVTMAAQMCGYASTAYFCREFRQENAMTPSQYREEQRERREKEQA